MNGLGWEGAGLVAPGVASSAPAAESHAACGGSTRALGVMSASVHLLFRSTGFPPEPGEDEETNPGVFGRALAVWLADQLPRRGRTVKGIIPEDFGRLVEVQIPRGRLYIAVSSTDHTATEWRVFAMAEQGFLSRLVRTSVDEQALSKLLADLRSILETAPGITELREEAA